MWQFRAVVLDRGAVEQGGPRGGVLARGGGGRCRTLRGDEDDVGVGAAEAEAGDPGDREAGVLGPLARILDDLQVVTVEVDVGVRAGEVQRLRQHPVAHGLDDLDDPGDARGGLAVAEVRLRRSEQQRGRVVAALAEHPAERTGLDRVAEDGAGAVGLDVVDLGGVEAGVGVGVLQHRDLRLRVRGGESVGPAVLIHRGAGDDGTDVVTVAAGVRQPLEHEHARPVGADDAVGVLREGADTAGGAEHAQLGEGDGAEGVGEDVHAAGQGDGGLALAQ